MIQNQVICTSAEKGKIQENHSFSHLKKRHPNLKEISMINYKVYKKKTNSIQRPSGLSYNTVKL